MTIVILISVLIAGSYTPICLITLKGPVGYTMLTIVWGIAILGILVKAFWVNCPKWFSSVLYIGMGWTCVWHSQNFLTLCPQVDLDGFFSRRNRLYHRRNYLRTETSNLQHQA